MVALHMECRDRRLLQAFTRSVDDLEEQAMRPSINIFD